MTRISMFLASALATPSLLLLLFLPKVAVAAPDTGASPRQFATVLSSLQDQMPECAFRCFNSSTGCATVEEILTPTVTDCLYSSGCTTHQRMDAERLLTTACSTEVRNAQARIRGISWSLWGLSAIFLVCRLVARSSFFAGMRFGPEDWAILTAFAVLTGVTIGAELMVVFGLGTDMWTLSDNNITVVLVLFFVAELAYIIESAITKISILLLYLRIFPDRTFQKYCIALIVVMVLFTIAFLAQIFAYCVPFDYAWMKWDNERSGKCIDINASTYAGAAAVIVLDLVIFFLPIPQLTKLELSPKKKAGIVLTFLVGLFVTICSGVRLKYLLGWTSSTNPTWDYADLAIWSLVELYVGVICACMPGMAALFRKVKQRQRDTAYYKRSRSSNNASQLGGTGTDGGRMAIRKTTIISVQRSHHGGGAGSESDIELVDRQENEFGAPSPQQLAT